MGLIMDGHKMDHFFGIPVRLIPYLMFASQCVLSPMEQSCLSTALEMLDLALLRDSVSLRGMDVAMLFISEETFTIRPENTDVLGSKVSLAIYYVDRWRKNKYNELQIITILLEELCHHFYLEPDEELVQDRVTAVVQTKMPHIQKCNLYRVSPTDQP